MTTEVKAWCPFRSWRWILARCGKLGLLSTAEGSIRLYIMERNLAVSLIAHTQRHNKSTCSLCAIETQHMSSRKFARHVTTALLIIEIILKIKCVQKTNGLYRNKCAKNKWIIIGISVQWLRWINTCVLTWEDIKLHVVKKENYIYI